MFHIFVDVVRTLACLVLTELQGFAVTPDVAMLGTEFTVRLAALHAFGTFMTMVFRRGGRQGRRKGRRNGEGKKRREKGGGGGKVSSPGPRLMPNRACGMKRLKCSSRR